MTFTELHQPGYWQDIVLTRRNYARQKYKKEIYITPRRVSIVDFQMIVFGGNSRWAGGFQ